MYKYAFGVLLSFFGVGCGFIDADGISYERTVVGNILVFSSQNETDTSLVLFDGEQAYDIIYQSCNTVLYDSLKGKIYVDEFITEQRSEYYQLDLINPSSKYTSQAYQEKNITKKEFDSLYKLVNVVYEKGKGK